MWPIWGKISVEKTTKTNCVFNAIQVFWKVVKIRPNLEYGRQMKLDISPKVPPSLKQRESSLISIFKSCFYEGCRGGLKFLKQDWKSSQRCGRKILQWQLCIAKLYFVGLSGETNWILYKMDGERTVKYEEWLISSFNRCVSQSRWSVQEMLEHLKSMYFICVKCCHLKWKLYCHLE